MMYVVNSPSTVGLFSHVSLNICILLQAEVFFRKHKATE